MDRVILHSDLNCFYASVEIALNPSLKGKAVAVCGSEADRHGIVLAKSEKAKLAGITTGMVVWQAREMCPGLITIEARHDIYKEYSTMVRKLYTKYTDLIEPYGLDECWLDVTGSKLLFGDGETIANDIRERVKSELGLTVSVGVSFNKIFAKLGSDMKKPDAVTVIDREHFKEKVWPLCADTLLYVGRASAQKLNLHGYHTIGDIANADPLALKKLLGVGGITLYNYANGFDNSPIKPFGYSEPPKSVGHGTTCTKDLENCDEVWRVFFELSQDIMHRLKRYGMYASGVQVEIKTNDLNVKQMQKPLDTPTQGAAYIARSAQDLFEKNFDWSLPVRALTVRAINLVGDTYANQVDMYTDTHTLLKNAKIDDTVELLRKKFGKGSILNASLMGEKHISDKPGGMILPGIMYKQ